MQSMNGCLKCKKIGVDSIEINLTPAIANNPSNSRHPISNEIDF